MITSGVIITLIICGTLFLLSVVNAISKAHERKQVNKSLDRFKSVFPNFEEKNKNNDPKDYFKKF